MVQVRAGGRIQNKPRMVCGFRQTRLGPAGGKKIRNRQRGSDAGTRHTPGKDTQITPPVTRLQASRGSRASLQADSQTPGSSPALMPTSSSLATGYPSSQLVCGTGWREDLRKPAAGLGGPVPRLDMRYRASSRRREFRDPLVPDLRGRER